VTINLELKPIRPAKNAHVWRYRAEVASSIGRSPRAGPGPGGEPSLRAQLRSPDGVEVRRRAAKGDLGMASTSDG
jgi:hypothetical protein